MTESTASVAVFYGPRTTITEHATLDEAIEAADKAVRKGRRVVACVRDHLGIMRYACDSQGRTWTRTTRGKHLPEWNL